MAVTYATADDVRRVLQTEAFTVNTKPTLADVEAFIEEAEDEIDKRTRRAWRIITITDEFQDVRRGTDPYLDKNILYSSDVRIFLDFKHVKTLDSGEGDKLEIWDGNSYEDWLITRTEGRENDFWQDEHVIMVKAFQFNERRRKARLTYRYGEDAVVPKDIRKATALMAAIDILENDDRTNIMTDTGDLDRITYDNRVTHYKAKLNRILDRYSYGFTI